MSGMGVSRFANRNNATAQPSAAAADNNSNGPPAPTPTLTLTPGGETTAAPADPFSSYEMMTPGQEFGGYDGANDFEYGGGMEDYSSPFAPMEYTMMYQAAPTTQEPLAGPTIAAGRTQERDENSAASANQKDQAAVGTEDSVKTPAAFTPPFQVAGSVAKSTVPADRPKVSSRSWLPKNPTHQWLSPTPNGGTTPKSTVPPPAAASKTSAAASQPNTMPPPRSGILFTARPKNQPVLQLVAAVPAPRMTSAAPAAAGIGRGASGGWHTPFAQGRAQEGSTRTVETVVRGEQGTGAAAAPVSILKTPRFQGKGGESPDEDTEKLAFTPPPPPAAHAVETHAARASFYETPGPHDQRRVIPTGPPATAAAVTPGTGSAGKKSVSFDPVKLTETFLIPRTLAGPGSEVAFATPPGQRRESGNGVPMDVDDENGNVPPETAFNFDATNDTFTMNCRESSDRVKVMNDEILDLNVYLSGMQADMQLLQANMADVANDTEGLCRGYEEILDLLAEEFPEDD